MRILFVASILMFLTVSANAQFWLGPKVGFQRTGFKYQNDEHLFLVNSTSEIPQNEIYDKVKHDYNFHVGGAMTYTASFKYAVHLELMYERVQKSIERASFDLDNKFTYNYLSLPLLLRVQYGKEPRHYYINAGPKISWWMSGKAFINESVLGNGDDEVIEYEIAYNFKANPEENVLVVDNPNRIQYALNIGGGALFDIATGARIQVDLRYSWGHSNLGFNRGSELEQYYENVEVSNQMISASVAYLIPYNPIDALKGKSTMDITQKSINKAKAKQRKNKNRKGG